MIPHRSFPLDFDLLMLITEDPPFLSDELELDVGSPNNDFQPKVGAEVLLSSAVPVLVFRFDVYALAFENGSDRTKLGRSALGQACGKVLALRC